MISLSPTPFVDCQLQEGDHRTGKYVCAEKKYQGMMLPEAQKTERDHTI